MVKEERKPSIVLIVEDDESIANLLQINLDLIGLDSLIARDGDEAIQLFDSSSILLVLLDLMLPGKDGWAVLDHIKTAGQGKVPVIITSAKTQKADMAKGFQMGVVDYITKPFDPVNLTEKVKLILDPKNKLSGGS